MYENAKTSTLTSTLGPGQCAPSDPHLSTKCNEIMNLSAQIDSIADTIRGKLFGQRSQETTNGKEIYSVDDTLDITKSILNSAYNTLCEINDRI